MLHLELGVSEEGLIHIPHSGRYTVFRDGLEKTKRAKMIHVLQGNMNRSKIASALFYQLELERKADLLLFNKQYREKRVTFMGRLCERS